MTLGDIQRAGWVMEPELNPVENIWQYLLANWLSNRVFEDYEAIVDVGCEAWNHLIDQPNVIRSIGKREWGNLEGRWYKGFCSLVWAGSNI